MTSKDESAAFFENLSRVNKKLVEGFVRQLSGDQKLESSEIFESLNASLLHDSERLAEIQARYYQQQLELWMRMAERASGDGAAPVAAPEKGDRRFSADEWRELPFFDYVKQAYLLNSRWMMELVSTAKLDGESKKKLLFFTRQFIDAMSPANFPATNPEVLKLALETNGESLGRGLKNLADDLEKGRISMTDENAFEVGGNLAITPGAVVLENGLIQLIQYRPLGDTVHRRPLLIVPPFINKYYILDLQPGNSFVRYALEQGHNVFIVSWRNIPPALGRLSWENYMEMGVVAALDAVREISRADRVNALGFCVGGTLLASTLAVLRAKRQNPVASLTLLATMLDFSDPGEIGVYIDEPYVAKRERDFRDGGLVHGSELAFTFASLRQNELVWNYVVNNYLKGRMPDAFDLLYWNSDGANLPGKLYAFYIRNMYLENNLRVPGKLTLCGVPVDLGAIDLPTYLLAAKEDHIVPWRSAYASTRLLRNRVEFVLAASGHIAGVVNPAAKDRRNYWVNPDGADDPDQWFAAAEERPGSWWRHWSEWLAKVAGKPVAAPQRLGSDRHPEIEPAPGRYVRERNG